MLQDRWKSRVMAAAMLCATPLFMGAIDKQTSMDERILIAHNQERASLGLEPLNWNPALAQSAQRWADYLASTGRFEHAPENRRNPEGENLWSMHGSGKRNTSAPASFLTTAPPAASPMWATTPSWSGPTPGKSAAPKLRATAKTYWSAAMPKPATGAANAHSEDGLLRTIIQK